MRIEEKIAAKLLHDVYHPFSACVCLDAKDDVLSVHQFDTEFCALPEDAAQPCARILLISNHHEGNMNPKKEDLRNLRKLRKKFGENVELLLYSEDEGFRKVEN